MWNSPVGDFDSNSLGSVSIPASETRHGRALTSPPSWPVVERAGADRPADQVSEVSAELSQGVHRGVPERPFTPSRTPVGQSNGHLPDTPPDTAPTACWPSPTTKPRSTTTSRSWPAMITDRRPGGPPLQMTYADGSHATAATVAISAPAPGAMVSVPTFCDFGCISPSCPPVAW